MIFDTTQLLEQTMNSKITELLYTQMIGSQRKSVGDPSSTTRPFTGRLTLDSRVAVQGAQNMTDAATMVTEAQTGVTAIKSKLDEMKQIATEAATRDNLTTNDYESMQASLQKLASELVDLAGSTSFNGMQLLNGSAGMNSDGVIQLQAGNSSLKQVLVNLVDGDVTTGVLDGSKINLNNLSGLMTVSDRGTAEAALGVLNDVYDRVYSVESQYSYDIKSLNNMSTLLKGQADILNTAVKNQLGGGQAKQRPEDYLLELLGGTTGGIFSSRG